LHTSASSASAAAVKGARLPSNGQISMPRPWAAISRAAAAIESVDTTDASQSSAGRK
jgi:hypothetical protein